MNSPLVADRPLSVPVEHGVPLDLEGVIQLSNPAQDWARLAEWPGLIPELARLQGASPAEFASLALGPELARQFDLTKPFEIGTFRDASGRSLHAVGSVAVRRYGDAALTLRRHYGAQRTQRDSYRVRGGANAAARLLDASISCELVRVEGENAGRLVCATNDELTPERVAYLASRATQHGQQRSMASLELPGRIVRSHVATWMDESEASVDPATAAALVDSLSELTRLGVGFSSGANAVYVEVELEYTSVTKLPTALLPETGSHHDATPGLSRLRHPRAPIARLEQLLQRRAPRAVRAVVESMAELRVPSESVNADEGGVPNGGFPSNAWVYTYDIGFEQARTQLVQEVAREQRATELAVVRSLLDRWVWGGATESAKDWLAAKSRRADGGAAMVTAQLRQAGLEGPTYAAGSGRWDAGHPSVSGGGTHERVWMCVEPAVERCSAQLLPWMESLVAVAAKRQPAWAAQTNDAGALPRWLLVGASGTPSGGGIVRVGMQVSKDQALSLVRLLSR